MRSFSGKGIDKTNRKRSLFIISCYICANSDIGKSQQALGVTQCKHVRVHIPCSKESLIKSSYNFRCCAFIRNKRKQQLKHDEDRLVEKIKPRPRSATVVLERADKLIRSVSSLQRNTSYEDRTSYSELKKRRSTTTVR